MREMNHINTANDNSLPQFNPVATTPLKHHYYHHASTLSLALAPPAATPHCLPYWLHTRSVYTDTGDLQRSKRRAASHHHVTPTTLCTHQHVDLNGKCGTRWSCVSAVAVGFIVDASSVCRAIVAKQLRREYQSAVRPHLPAQRVLLPAALWSRLTPLQQQVLTNRAVLLSLPSPLHLMFNMVSANRPLVRC